MQPAYLLGSQVVVGIHAFENGFMRGREAKWFLQEAISRFY